jgi:hypothetical protein
MPPEAQVIPMTPVNPAPVKMGKFAASRTIVRESWSILKQDKELLLFPIVSAIISLIAIGALVIWYMTSMPAIDVEAAKESMGIAEYAFLLVYYVIIFFIANFFQVGMYTIISARFNGQNLSFGDGMKGAWENMGKIFLWSLISATVGVILRAIADKSEILGKIVATLLGAAWNIMTYFSLLSLVIGNKSVKESFKESAAIIRRTWGETLIVNVGVGFFFGLITLGVAFALFVLAFLIQDFIVAIALAVIFVLYLACLSVVSSTLGAIFKFALYEYGRSGKIIPGFTPDVIANAFKKK